MRGRGRTQIFFASTLYGVATLAAALDADCFPAADRRLLLVSNNSTTPETTPGLEEMPGFERLRPRFDRVLSWNETISPFHPGGWGPRLNDAPLWERHLRLLWGLGDDEIEIAVESIQVNPALALVQLFPSAPIDVYADGLMSYGPTRNKLDPLVGTRIRRLLHLDLVPGLRPLLLTEFGVEAQIVPTERFTAVLAELAELPEAPESRETQELPETREADAPAGAAGADRAARPDAGYPDLPEIDSPALLMGQYLSALDILSAEEEERLHVTMLRGAVDLGHRRIVFKPHPTAPARWSRMLEQEAVTLGVELTVVDSPVLAEVLYQRMRPALVVGCFSTALLTATTLYALPVASTGTGLLLERLSPYQNSNRVPVTIVDALLPQLDDRAAVQSWTGETVAQTGRQLSGLIAAVGFAMQPQIYPNLRPAAERYLTTSLDARTWHYFKRRRLTALALPGAVPSQLAFLPRNATVRRVARRARAVQRTLKKRAAFG
ncbi:polysialyltransferase family glycosyltransferase [Streptomyces sp. H27-D2]|uniref:polysialyltransferase family glycosyltransferase n=1 Tax=Streptomyces sp. H27-D2 TaxID=3046304 RepID=UPI002DBF5DF0|nr:polysialyltransferase family glycosyltransferase [Streptomyces sp. H27-D2]MEC4015929.1 polysialyltransferase family glycosyltransferase [Streptomyces sp. H27-D2]